MAVEPGPFGWSTFVETGPKPDPKSLNLKDLDPFYAGDLELINEDLALREAEIKRNAARAQQLYQLNVQQASASAGGGGDYGLAAAERSAAMLKEKADRDDKNFRENMRERLASRGALDSGQFGWENNEATWNLDFLKRQIESDLQGRREAIASARASAQAALASRLQEMALRNQWAQEDVAFDLQSLNTAAARQRGQAALAAWARLQESGALMPPGETYYWDPAAGVYRSKSGKVLGGAAEGPPVQGPPPPSELSTPPVDVSPLSPAFFEEDNRAAREAAASGRNYF